jgi:predicted RNA binding protein YcfA (HicA-like mRNA interferase family)
MRKIQSIGKSTGKNKTKMKTYKTAEAIRLAERNGWVLVRTRGNHRYFKHPDNPKLLLISNDLNRMVWERCVNEYGLDLSK